MPHHDPDTTPDTLSADDWDELMSPRPATCGFDKIVAAAVSRRAFLGGLITFGSGASAMGPWRGAVAALDDREFPFTPIPAQTDHTVHVPEGYEWQVLIRWGDPLFPDTPAFDHSTGGAEDSSDRVFGENTDGMELFVREDRHVIAVNHEFANRRTNLPNRSDGRPESLSDVRKLQNLQGVTVMEVAKRSSGWIVMQDSPLNRRITHRTPVGLTGPAAGHRLLQTDDDPTGTMALGTFNNCGSGKTPWGTYLTCEENFNGYFGSTDPDLELPEDFERYGIRHKGWAYDYHAFDSRFDVSRTPNEPRRVGYVVEIDPFNPDAAPVKRTGLGRFKHENAECVLSADGRVVVYMGDDERGEYLYRFVSDDRYIPGAPTEELLNSGTLFAARFAEDGWGEWVALSPEDTGMSAAEICIFTRQAASRVNATTMDRPEWVAVHQAEAMVCCALTNNKDRGRKPNAGGDPTPVGGPNPREKNRYGQIVRWWPEGEDHTAQRFFWDLFVMAGNPEVHDTHNAGSGNINAGNLFNSPDGMQFDSTGLLWIQTDGDDSNSGHFEGMGNNQMLAGDPVSGRIERFMTGPKGSEVTGLTWSADLRTMFVGIQHPDAPFPDGEGRLPRSSIVAIRRKDGEPVG